MSGFWEKTLQRYGYERSDDLNARIEEAVKQEVDKVHHWLAETADAQQFDFDYAPSPVYAHQSDLYRLSPILATALDILADDVGLSKGHVKRMVGEEERGIPNHEFEMLMRTPNPLDSGMEFMRDTTMSYKLNGNAIWWINRQNKNDKPLELWPIPFEMIKPVPDKRLYLSHYEYFPGLGKQPIKIPVWQIVHFKTYNPKNRYVGLSPIESLAMTISGNQGMRKTKTKQYTEYGGAPPSILAFNDFVQNEAWADLKTEVKNASMRNEMMLLRGVGEKGVSWMSRALNSKDAEFIENLQQDMVDVFNRMTPGLLAMLDKNSTEANALAARATYSEKSLWKTLETLAQKVTSDLMPVYGRKLFYIYDDPRVVDRKLELEEQAAYERTHTTAEVREKFYGDEPVGDERDDLFPVEITGKKGADSDFFADDDTTPENEAGPDTGADSVSLKAALDELLTWRTVALRGKAVKAQNFLCAYVPRSMVASIKADLPQRENKDEIAALFDQAAESLRAQPQGDALDLLAQELKRANDLLESTV